MSLFSAVADLFKPATPPSPRIQEALNRISELVDPMVLAASGAERQLLAPLEHALGYCDGIISALPGPFEINRAAFSVDPLVHALFATAEDIEQMLGRSQAIRDFLAEPQCWANDRFFALLAARRQQKNQLGLAQQGDVIRRDVPQTVVYFHDQTLIEPFCILDTTLESLRNRLFDSLLLTFREHVDALRAQREGMRTDVAQERAHLNIIRGKAPGEEFELRSRHVDELEAKLRETAESLMPEQQLTALSEFLGKPDHWLRFSEISITIDRLGIVSDAEPDDVNVHTLKFPELRGRDKRQYAVMLACIHREEAQAAVEAVRDQQRRYMII